MGMGIKVTTLNLTKSFLDTVFSVENMNTRRSA